MIFLYRVCTFLLYPLLLIVVYYRKIIQKEDSIRFKEKIFPTIKPKKIHKKADEINIFIEDKK